MGFLSSLFGEPKPVPPPTVVIKNVVGETLIELQVRDLADIDLSNLDLRHASLRGLVLWNVNLENSNLLGADARGASFQKCNLKGVELSFSNCASAEFSRQQPRWLPYVSCGNTGRSF